ncbi:MAG: YraN family protein [Pseudomonadota bacterium]
MADRRAAERRGRRSEWIAAASLQMKGYRIIARRVRTRAGEIDLISSKGGLVAFVEVKARADLNTALEAVTARTWQRVSRAAELWIAKRQDLVDYDWRFDIIAVTPGTWPYHARDAWRPSHDN